MNVQTVDFQDPGASTALATSLRETGFAVLVNHPIDAARIDQAYDAWAEFFASDSKHDWLRDPDDQDGFFPFQSENAKGATAKDLKEFYHVYSWGRVPDSLNALTRQLYQDLVDLGVTMLGWLDDEMPEDVRAGMTAPLRSMMQDSQQSLFRILHYPPVADDANPSAIRAAAHEDINLITLLLAGSRPGLEAMDTQGNWHSVSCDPGMITVNNGDMLSLATDGHYPSTPHRVINPDAVEGGKGENVSRYSMPMFLHPHKDAALKPDFTADMFLQQRLKEIGLK
ncbi:MAG: isopenicillin N synthase family oxygenase [Alphaproteobacteria bacterium]|nr:isopenicillin N synthase family oxygenase [Alphaproteobacteria bacterium]